MQLLFISVQCKWGTFEPVTECSYETCDGAGFQFFEREKTKEERFGGACYGGAWKKEKCPCAGNY